MEGQGTPFRKSAAVTIAGGVLLFMAFTYMMRPAPRMVYPHLQQPQMPRDKIVDRLPKTVPQKTVPKEVAKAEQARKDSAYDDTLRAGKTALEAANYKDALQAFTQAARLKPGDGEAARLIREVKDEETKKKASSFDGRWTPPTRLRPAFGIAQHNTTISGTYSPSDGSMNMRFSEGKLLKDDELLIAIMNEHGWRYSVKFKLLESDEAEVSMWISPDDAQTILRTAPNLGKTPPEKGWRSCWPMRKSRSSKTPCPSASSDGRS